MCLSKNKRLGTKFEKIKQKSLNQNLVSQYSSIMIKIHHLFFIQKFGNLILISSIMGINNPKFETHKGTNMSSPIEYSAIKSGLFLL